PHREALPRCPPDPPRHLSLRDDELLPKQGVLGDETRRGGARRRRPAPPRTEGPRSCGALYRGQRADAICSQNGLAHDRTSLTSTDDTPILQAPSSAGFSPPGAEESRPVCASTAPATLPARVADCAALPAPPE